MLEDCWLHLECRQTAFYDSHMHEHIGEAFTFMNSFMVVGGYFLPGPWISTLSLGHTNQPIE